MMRVLGNIESRMFLLVNPECNYHKEEEEYIQ